MKKAFARQLKLLLALFCALLLVFTVVLFDTQVIHGSEYLDYSMHSITSYETVKASRGIITDRNGTVLVSNRLSYSLTFDLSLLNEEEDANAAILRLIQLCEEQGLSWNDTLPITQEAPFLYTLSTASSSQISRLSKLLQYYKWSGKTLSTEDRIPDLTATDFIANMCKKFDISSTYSDTEIRKIVGVRYELALRKVISTSEYILVDDISPELISILADGRYAGAAVRSSSQRKYETEYAAHILGFTGYIDNYDETWQQNGYAMDDIVGRSGVEAAFESYLRGIDGERIVTTDRNGILVSEVYDSEPQPGNTVALTIDIELEKIAEDALAQRIEELTAKDGIARGGAVAIVQVNSGDILALGSYPTYSLSTYREDAGRLNSDPLAPLYNRATQGTYAPGSTFKPCVAVAALESQVITTHTQIRDLGRYAYFKDYQPRCWIYTSYGTTHGLINVAQAITESCNYFFYDVGRQTGISTIAHYASLFGLGEPTGVEISERTGRMTTPEYVNSLEGRYWTDGLTLQAAIGQGLSEFTPLQLSNYIATLVSGGTRYRAHLLKDVKSYQDGAVIYDSSSEPPAQTFAITAENLSAIKTGMGNLVRSGSVASYFKDCPVTVGAKTGTAQTTSETSNGVFVCFAPFDNPEIAIAIVIEKGGSGGALATVAANILKGYYSSAQSQTITGENELLP